MNTLSHIPGKWSQLRHSNICKNTGKWSFQTLITFLSELKVAPNHLLRRSLCPSFDFNTFPHFPWKWSQFRHSKTCKKLKNALFKCSQYFFFELMVAPKPFSEKVPMPKSWFKSISTFCLTFPEIGFNFITQKTENDLSKTLRTLAFYWVASKLFSGMLTITNFGFKDFWTLCFAFRISRFNFLT